MAALPALEFVLGQQPLPSNHRHLLELLDKRVRAICEMSQEQLITLQSRLRAPSATDYVLAPLKDMCGVQVPMIEVQSQALGSVLVDQNSQPLVHLTQTLTLIDDAPGEVALGYTVDDHQLWAFKGLQYNDQPIAFVARKLLHEGAMGMCAASCLAGSAVYVAPEAAWLKLPLMCGSLEPLQEMAARNERFPGVDWTTGVLLGLRTVLADLERVHSMNMVHRDIKPGNILHRGSSASLRLGDYEMARYQGERQRTYGGTPGYMAPEQVTNLPLQSLPGASLKAADMFGVGGTFLALFGGCLLAIPRMSVSLVRSHYESWYYYRTQVAMPLRSWGSDARYAHFDAYLASYPRS